MRRDGRKHTSPNSGIPESAMAGALGVRLGGPSTYGGVMVEKPYIGDSGVADYPAVGRVRTRPRGVRGNPYGRAGACVP